MILIDGKKVAAELREKLKKEVSELKDKYNILHICYNFHPTLNDCIRYDEVISKKELFICHQNIDKLFYTFV